MKKALEKNKPQEFHLKVTVENQTAIDLLAPISNLSKQFIKQAMRKGAVWLTHEKHTQRIRRAKKILPVGDDVYFYYNPAVLANEPLEATLIADEGDYSIWDKPHGMLSQGSKWGDHCVINRVVEKCLEPKRPVFLVHRLDKAASGLMIIAHSKTVAAQLANMFQERSIEKHYQAKVHGDHSQRPQPETINEVIDGRDACSHVRCLQFNNEDNTSLLDVHIETGRKHQIRRHLAGISLPVVGDRLYGNDDKQDLALIAVSLQFTCPITKTKKHYQLSDKDINKITNDR